MQKTRPTRPSLRKPRRRTRRREGAAMLIVMIVLLMATATATFAIHSTSMEIRSAGYMRQATQAQLLAEGGAYAMLGYIDTRTPSGVRMQYFRSPVMAGVSIAPGEPVLAQPTNMVRVSMQSFQRSSGMTGPAVETNATRVPSLGPYGYYQPSFLIDGTDLHYVPCQKAGQDLTGRGAMCAQLTITARAHLAPPSDITSTGDPRSFHDTLMRARTVAEMGPLMRASGH